jgi:hypothetical protein
MVRIPLKRSYDYWSGCAKDVGSWKPPLDATCGCYWLCDMKPVPGTFLTRWASRNWCCAIIPCIRFSSSDSTALQVSELLLAILPFPQRSNPEAILNRRRVNFLWIDKNIIAERLTRVMARLAPGSESVKFQEKQCSLISTQWRRKFVESKAIQTIRKSQNVSLEYRQSSVIFEANRHKGNSKACYCLGSEVR